MEVWRPLQVVRDEVLAYNLVVSGQESQTPRGRRDQSQ